MGLALAGSMGVGQGQGRVGDGVFRRVVVPGWVMAGGVSWLAGCGGSLGAPIGDAGVDVVGADVVVDHEVGDGGPQDASIDVQHVKDAGFDVTVTDGSVEAGACAAPAAPAPVCAGLCGNGAVDSCQGQCGPCPGGGGPGGPPNWDGGTCCQTLSESCDGTNLGGSTCAALGFSGGTLACNGGCTFDTSGCNHCGTDSHILACGNTPSAPDVTSLALAASDTAIALAWAAGPQGQRGMRVSILAPDLGVTAQVGCLGTGDVAAVAIAATPSGWIAAAQTPAGVALYPLRADGTPVGSASVIPGAATPILAQQPGGGPLLVWVAGQSGAFASFLDAAASVGTTKQLFGGSPITEPQYGSAVWVGDGFLVALRTNSGASVVHVALDGTLGASHSVGAETEYPQLAWTGSEARLTYGSFGGTAAVDLLRLDATGAPIGSALTAGSTPQYYDPAPIVGVRGDSLVLLPGYTGGTGIASHVDVGRFTADGKSVYAAYVLGQGGVDRISQYRLAVRGPDVVAAWVSGANWTSSASVSGSSVQVARIVP